MGDWNLFFATTAGSAATLVGLLFVATQLHIGVFSDPKNRWAALAQSTLTILATAFALSLSFLVPALNTQVRGEIILGVRPLRSGEESGSGGRFSGAMTGTDATCSCRASGCCSCRSSCMSIW